MKKFYSFLIAAVALVGFAACESNEEATPEAKTMSFVASFDSTRTMLADESGVVAWCEDDTIAVSNGIETKEFTISEILEDGSAVFTGEPMEGDSFTAIYPYTEETEFSVATEQEAVAGSFAHGAAVSTAVCEDGKTLVFENQCAVLKFQVPTDASTVEFFNGEDLVVKVAGEMTAGKNYYAVVMPDTYTFTVKIDGEVSKKSLTALELEANKIYNLKTLPAVPVVSDYGLLGTHNNWDTDNPTPMYVEGNYSVVRGIAGGTEFKFYKGGVWLGIRSKDTCAADTWNLLGTKNITLPKSADSYDIYLNIENGVFNVVASGSTIKDFASEGKKIYLNVGVWGNDAYYEAWVWGSSKADAWYKFGMIDNNLYVTVIPNDATGMKILRKDPAGHKSEDWVSWNDSGDQTIEGGKNMFVVKDWNNYAWETR